MIAVINQFNGLGDIIFIFAIAEHYSKLGYDVILPVKSKFVNLQKHFNNFKIVNMDEFTLCDLNSRTCNNLDIIYLPLRFSSDCGDQTFTMVHKYTMVNLDLNIWRNFKWIRDNNTEKRLYYDILNLKDNENYNLINKNRSNKSFMFDVKNENKNIYLQEYNGVTLLDWMYVIEHAKEIHTVGTSLNYVIEIANLKSNCCYVIYNNDYDFSLYSKIISKPYQRIEIW